jgi:predicted nucleic acid-binding protein
VNAFFDSNIVVYAHDRSDVRKQARAIDLMAAHARDATLTISTQVLAESYSILLRKRLLKSDDAFAAMEALVVGRVVSADAASVMRGLQLSRRYRLSSWDGLIVQAALDAGCTTLFTEDMQAGQRFGELEVVNPFDDAVHQPRAAWPAPAAKKAARMPGAKRAAKR